MEFLLNVEKITLLKQRSPAPVHAAWAEILVAVARTPAVHFILEKCKQSLNIKHFNVNKECKQVFFSKIRLLLNNNL